MEAYKYTTWYFPDDYEGKVTATFIERHSERPTCKAVLYIHGYLDYFFQDHMAERIVASGRNFYAVDLRKYGRSYLSGQHYNYCKHLSEYYPEIDKALESIKEQGNTDITLIGHSTGGLLSALYCAEGKYRTMINRLILNSPFLEFNASWFDRWIVIPLASVISLVFPYASTENKLNDNYFRSVHISEYGELNFDLRHKPPTVPLYFSWLQAVGEGHRKVRQGLHLTIPTLVLCSQYSSNDKEWSDHATKSDTILNVEDIKRLTPKLGDRAECRIIEDGLHDLVLSRKDVRERVLGMMISFMNMCK